MRFLLAFVTAMALVATFATAAPAADLGTPPNCVPPAIFVESQSWVRTPGDGGSGKEHDHTGVCFDFTKSSVPAGTTFHVRTIMHDTNSHLRGVRYAEDSTVKQSHTMDVPGVAEGEVVRFDDFTTTASMVNEVRFTSDLRDPDLDPNLGSPGRWYNSTRFPGDGVGRFGAAGWCVGHEYTNVYLGDPAYQLVRFQKPVPEPWNITVKAEDNLYSVVVDPNFHAGSPGTQVVWRQPANNTFKSVSIPTQNMSPGVHRLVLIDTDNEGEVSPFGECSGVLNVPFVVQ